MKEINPAFLTWKTKAAFFGGLITVCDGQLDMIKTSAKTAEKPQTTLR